MDQKLISHYIVKHEKYRKIVLGGKVRFALTNKSLRSPWFPKQKVPQLPPSWMIWTGTELVAEPPSKSNPRWRDYPFSSGNFFHPHQQQWFVVTWTQINSIKWQFPTEQAFEEYQIRFLFSARSFTEIWVKIGLPPRNGKGCSDRPVTLSHPISRRGEVTGVPPLCPSGIFVGTCHIFFWNPKIGEFLITFHVCILYHESNAQKRATKISPVRPKKIMDAWAGFRLWFASNLRKKLFQISCVCSNISVTIDEFPAT